MSDPTLRTQGQLRRHLLWIVPALAVAVGATLALAGAPDDTDGILGVTRESGGAVVVTLTPETFEDRRLTVEMAVNTHTVDDLHTYDLREITTLRADDAEVAPISAPRLEGHHSDGDLVFPLESLPSALTIEVRGLDEPALRTFRWP